MIDAARFEEFVREYQDMVFATAVRLLGRPADAEDIAQSVFLKAFQRFEEIGGSPSAAGWLKTVTTNLCLNQLTRYRSRWRLFSELGRAGGEPGGASFEASLVAGGSHGADLILERADDSTQLERALRNLPDHQRVPLVLFHFEEKSYQEIADALHRSLARIKTDIHRGREALRSQLEARHGSR